MKYYLAFLPPQDFQEDFQILVRQFTNKFNLEKLNEKKRIPHITLKMPFEQEYLSQVEQVLSQFNPLKSKESYFKITDISGFDQNIYPNPFVHFSINASDQARLIHQSLTEKLREINGLNFMEHNDNPNYHITIAKNHELKNEMNNVSQYLKTLGRPLITMPFDNITLFKKADGRTEIYKNYRI